MVGVELVAGYLFAWLAGKARRAGQRADGQIDTALDAGVDRLCAKLYSLVAGKLRGDRGLARLEREANEGLAAPSADASTWIALAVKDASQADPEFDRAMTALVAQLQQATHSAGNSVSARSGGLAVGGSQTNHATDHSIAAGVSVPRVAG